jgi:hypothetical protein
MYRKDELVISLANRVARIVRAGNLIHRDLPKGQDGGLPVPGKTRLSRESQRLIFVMIDMLDDILNIAPRRY